MSTFFPHFQLWHSSVLHRSPCNNIWNPNSERPVKPFLRNLVWSARLSAFLAPLKQHAGGGVVRKDWHHFLNYPPAIHYFEVALAWVFWLDCWLSSGPSRKGLAPWFLWHHSFLSPTTFRTLLMRVSSSSPGHVSGGDTRAFVRVPFFFPHCRLYCKGLI